MKLNGWLDTRLISPSSSHFSKYVVIFLNGSSVFIGLCGWLPKNGYTSGEWQTPETTNGNPLGGQVIYWRQWPEKPVIATRSTQ